ncbi:MAG: TIM barrel protein [Pseudohongiella sp.]|nr:TIM barrel protein [Pseudohongiella sp.]
MIYISTGGVGSQPAWQTSSRWFEDGIKNIELSGGAYDPDQLSQLKRLKCKINFQLHNYFPPQSIPFVFNLASLDYEVGKKSFQHVEKAMEWSIELDQPRFGFHAGFLIDPKVNELGQRIKSRDLFDRHEALSLFLERVNRLSEIASKLGVQLLIENNVLSANNYREFNANPFLMATPEECVEVMQQTPDNVGLLIDVAHLKVSAQSINFDPILMLSMCSGWIGGYHLSDNDGLSDSNDPITHESWFWPHIKRDIDYYTVEVYGLTPSQLCQQQLIVQHQIEKSYGNI